MFCVELDVKPSEVHGYGLFAKEKIKKGTVIWKSVKKFEKRVNENFYYTLNEVQKNFTDIYFPHYRCKLHIFCDYSIFLNHSNSPNVKNVNADSVEAIKDIEKGTELFGNYSELH